MTEYKIFSKELTAVNDEVEMRQYLEQAKEAYFKEGMYGVTFLPLAEGKTGGMRFPLVCAENGYKNDRDKEAYAYIMQKTLEKTFEQGNPAHDSAVIVEMTKDDVNDYYKPNVSEWRSVTYNAIKEHMSKDFDWFGKLSPAAQLAAIGMEVQTISRGSTPSLMYENDLHLDFSKAPKSGYNAELEMAANLVLSSAYRRVESGSIIRAEPLESRLSWEIKAAALEAQLKSHSYRGKIPSVPVFVDLMKKAETSEQQLKLAELSKEPDFKEALRYSNSLHSVAQAFDDVAARGEATQKLFYEVMYNFGLTGNTLPQLHYDAMNYHTLQEAKAELRVQQIVDDKKREVARFDAETARLNKRLKDGRLSEQEKAQTLKIIEELHKKEPISVIADLKLVAKYRPEFLEQPARMTPDMCSDVLREVGDRLSAQTQLEMMTKVVSDLAKGLNKGNGFNEYDFNKLGNYIERADKIVTSSKTMGKFVETLAPVMNKAQAQYDKDKKFLADAAKANRELSEANSDKNLFVAAREEYNGLISKRERIKNERNEFGLKEPSEEVMDAYFAEVKAGNKDAMLAYEPKSGFGKLFMSKKEKQAQIDIQNLVTDINEMLDKFAKRPEFEYVREVSDDKIYYDMMAQKEEDITKMKRTIGNKYYDYTSNEEQRVDAFEKAGIVAKFAGLTAKVEQRTAEMQRRAQTDLSLQFGGQEFATDENGKRKPLTGLVKEEEMAQGIYKQKIAELRKSIESGIKQDMEERGVNQTPSLDKPNEVGKPMTPESTKKIRKDMKDLKQYQDMVHD